MVKLILCKCTLGPNICLSKKAILAAASNQVETGGAKQEKFCPCDNLSVPARNCLKLVSSLCLSAGANSLCYSCNRMASRPPNMTVSDVSFNESSSSSSSITVVDVALSEKRWLFYLNNQIFTFSNIICLCQQVVVKNSRRR